MKCIWVTESMLSQKRKQNYLNFRNCFLYRLMVKHSDAADHKISVDDKSGLPDGSQSGVESNPATDKSQGESKGVEKKEKKEEKKEKKESMSIHS